MSQEAAAAPVGAGLPRVLSPEPLAGRDGATVAVDEDAAQHLRVRRVAEGERVGLADGRGGLAEGVLVRLAKRGAEVAVERTASLARPAELHLLAPVGDRDRMLWLAEKAAELAATSWCAVRWHRSRSVSPRGEGEAFHAKVRARMVGALLQSGGAWLPELLPDAAVDAALALHPGAHRLLCDAHGAPLLVHRQTAADAATAVAVGPEGGLEPHERAAAVAAGWQPVALGATILRFETAGVVALGVLRAPG